MIILILSTLFQDPGCLHGVVCSRVVISGVVGGGGNPSWNTKWLIICRGHNDYTVK